MRQRILLIPFGIPILRRLTILHHLNDLDFTPKKELLVGPDYLHALHIGRIIP